MLTYKIEKVYNSERSYVEGSCLSSDDKPTEVANGSMLMEMDTSTMYLYDEENELYYIENTKD